MMSNKIKDSYENIIIKKSEKEELLDNIWSKRKTDKVLKISKIRRMVSVAAILAICLVVGSATVYAIERILSGEQVFKVFYQEDGTNKEEINNIASKFNKKESDVKVVKCNGYTITYLGLVTSKDVLDKNLNDDMKEEVTYLAAAVEKNDGYAENVGEMKEQFVISPFIQGYEPWVINSFSLGSDSQCKLIDNVYYIIMKYDTNIEVFADKNMFIGVFDSRSPADGFGYKLDSEGNIIRDKKCKSLNALFQIHLDKNKANSAKAEEIIKHITEYEEEYKGNENITAVTQDELKKLCEESELIEKDVVLEKDDEGIVRYGYAGRMHNAYKGWLETGKVDYQWDYREEQNILYIYEMNFKDNQYYQTVYKYSGDPTKFVWIQERIQKINQ